MNSFSKILVASLALLPLAASAEITGYYGKTATQKLEISGPVMGQVSNATFVIKADLIRKEKNWKWKLVNQNVERIVCRGEAGKGNGDWKGFYKNDLSEAKKADALSDAILGVGEVRAPKLVKYFNNRVKPGNWDEFVALIKEANEKIPGLYGAVVTKYGDQNKVNLGYFSKENCNLEIVGTRQDWDWVLVDEEFVNSTVSQQVVVAIEGAYLIPGEKDSLSVKFTPGGGDSLEVNNYGANKYQVVGRSVQDGVITYRVAASRKLVSAGNTLEVNMINENGLLVLLVTDRAYAAGFEQFLGLTTVELSGWQDNWTFDDELFRVQATLSQFGPVTRVETGYRIRKGIDMYVNFELSRVGSSLFSNGSSRDLNTSNVEF